MQRTSLNYLENWLAAADRKPLVMRGARQVGKTWLVRHLSEKSKKQLIELNLEKQPNLASLFDSNEPRQILINLSAIFGQNITPEKCLLFLDEIQTAPQLLGKLRWFAEDLPQLPVITAGSLLEFVLAQHSFSMPVGRISYMHLEPLSFEEFLLANEKHSLWEYVTKYDLNAEIPLAIHEQLTTLFKEYVLIGGLPAAVASWTSEHSLNKINQIHHDLLATYRDDFAKYRGGIALERLDETMMAIPKMLGQKFKFSTVNATINATTIKQVLNLLHKARISHAVMSTAANGVPLGAEIKENYFKEIFLDTGLCCAALGLNLNQINTTHEIILINNGGIAEQVAGQLLRTIDPPYIEPALYYWRREEKGSSAEIDYIIQHGNQIIPIEVKAGSTGGLKSLHQFMKLKKLDFAIRINSDFPSKTNVNIKDHAGNTIKYTLLSMPFYLMGQIHRLLIHQDKNTIR